MTPKFICHPDFANLVPRNVFCKEDEVTPERSAPSEQVNRHLLFRRSFTLPRFTRASLRITADDYYKLYVNGRFVTQGPAPSYPTAYYYNEVDLSEYLTEGENTIAVHAYYQGLINRVWVSGDSRQMLWCELSLDGETVLVSDTDWRCHDHTGYTECGKFGYDVSFAEFYHSAAPEVGFEKPEFDDSAWGFASVYAAADYTLIPQPTPQLEFETILPKEVTEIPGGIRIDFGQEAAGYLVARARGKAGDVIVMRYAEEMSKDGLSIRHKMRCNCCYEEKWELSGADDLLNQFDYKAFRYAEIFYPEGVQLEGIELLVRHYPYREAASFKDEGNADLQAILKLCKDTIRYGVQEGILDCLTREKAQYLGDATISGRAQAILSGDTTLMKKTIMDFCHSSFICPGIMAVTCSSYMQEIADYSLQFPAQAVWVYSMDGDIDFLRSTEPYMDGLYQYLLGFENEDGLLCGWVDKWNLVDWPDNLRDGYDFDLTRPQKPGMHNVINAFWIGYLEAMDEYLTILGRPKTGKTERAKEAFIRTFYSSETGLFCDTPGKTHSAVQSNVLPLLFDIGTDDPALVDRIVDFVCKKRLTSMGVYMAFFTLAALIKHGKRDIAIELATDPGCWLNMIRQGATVTYEAWGREQKSNCSLFHPWAVGPMVVFADIPRIY